MVKFSVGHTGSRLSFTIGQVAIGVVKMARSPAGEQGLVLHMKRKNQCDNGIM